MVRINQHGTLDGARVNRTKTTAEIMEIHPLGRITRFAAENIENDMTIEYRKRYGRGRVRGGYNISLVSSLVPNYTPGSLQAVLLIAGCLLLAVVLFAVILYV
ncbi:MAG: hypothetical protein JWN38_1073 [Candidatus Saccharibacteria bacterium]|nr:hypothetical protein [Candidatus Saccharibacteria bacterium]